MVEPAAPDPRYPEIEPYAEGWLATTDGQQIHWETSGRSDGKPAVVFHGGPGSGIGPGMRRLFDPERYRIVQFDQRGSGRSTPSAAEPDVDLSVNTTDRLLDDIERLREHLGIERWLVQGASWGSILALAYAEAYHPRVSELIVWGVTTGRWSEFDWIFDGGASVLFPAEWERLVEALPEEERQGGIPAAYLRRLLDPDPAIHDAAALDWARWESVTPDWPPVAEVDPMFEDPTFRLTYARLVTHYASHHGFLEDGALVRGAAALARDPRGDPPRAVRLRRRRSATPGPCIAPGRAPTSRSSTRPATTRPMRCARRSSRRPTDSRVRHEPAVGRIVTQDPKAFWSGRLEKDFSLSGVGYIGLGIRFNQALYAQRERVLLRVLRRDGIAVRGATIVEYGPGTGFYTAIFAREGAAMVDGLDITDVSARELAARFPQYRFQQADITAPLPVAPGSADIVAAFDVLFHVVDEDLFAAALDNAARALRPGGVLLVSDLFLHVAPDTTGASYYIPRTLARWGPPWTRPGSKHRRPHADLRHDAPAARRAGSHASDLDGLWSRVSGRLKKHPKDGRMIGVVLGAADRLLSRIVRDGPSTELLVARRR